MKASLLKKLDILQDRFEELTALLGDGEVISDQAKFRAYSKEYAEVEPVILAFREFRKVQSDLEGAQALLKDSDPDLREMAEEEVAQAREQLVELDEALSKARASTPDLSDRMTNLGVAYVCFARDNPALYRVMYDRSRDKDALPDQLKEGGAYYQVRDTLAERARTPIAEIDLELATIAGWCAGHGSG